MIFYTNQLCVDNGADNVLNDILIDARITLTGSLKRSVPPPVYVKKLTISRDAANTVSVTGTLDIVNQYIDIDAAFTTNSSILELEHKYEISDVDEDTSTAFVGSVYIYLKLLITDTGVITININNEQDTLFKGLLQPYVLTYIPATYGAQPVKECIFNLSGPYTHEFDNNNNLYIRKNNTVRSTDKYITHVNGYNVNEQHNLQIVSDIPELRVFVSPSDTETDTNDADSGSTI